MRRHFCRLGIGMVALLVLGGCRGTRTVMIERPAPPPSVVVKSDTVYQLVPDTAFAPPERVEVVRTVPVEVVRYVQPRPDTARAAQVWRLAVDSAHVAVSLRGEDLRLRRPRVGERLVCIALGPERLDCRVEGRPTPPGPVLVECPACAVPLVPRTLSGYAFLVILAAAGAFVGLVARPR